MLLHTVVYLRAQRDHEMWVCVCEILYTVNAVYYEIISLSVVLHSHSQHVSEVDKHSVLREKYQSEQTTGGFQQVI